MKLKVTAEGRKNIWLPEKESLKEFIKSRNLEAIHNFRGGSSLIIGADHDVESVLEDIDRAERLAVFTDNSNMGHSMALIIQNMVECYDIGKVTEEDLVKGVVQSININ